MNDLKDLFSSPLAKHFADFVEHKRMCGYKYKNTTLGHLRRLDRFLADNGLSKPALPQRLVEKWIAKKPHEAYRNQLLRVTSVRMFSLYLIERRVQAYYPSKYAVPRGKVNFVPYIFSMEQISRLFKEADKATSRWNTYPHLAGFPVILRLLYSCGLRVGEASRLQWRDIDLVRSTILIRASKGDKDRLVVMSRQMRDVLKEHWDKQKSHYPDSPVFIGCFGGNYSPKSIYHRFREMLFPAGISHGGIGKGPRLHDLRHTFAVHNLEKWLKAKANMNVNLSILADYLGHTSLNETQSYLRLMPSIYPEIISRMEKSVGKEIRRQQNETN